MQTPLQIALRKKNKAIIRILLENGARLPTVLDASSEALLRECQTVPPPGKSEEKEGKHSPSQLTRSQKIPFTSTMASSPSQRSRLESAQPPELSQHATSDLPDVDTLLSHSRELQLQIQRVTNQTIREDNRSIREENHYPAPDPLLSQLQQTLRSLVEESHAIREENQTLTNQIGFVQRELVQLRDDNRTKHTLIEELQQTVQTLQENLRHARGKQAELNEELRRTNQTNYALIETLQRSVETLKEDLRHARGKQAEQNEEMKQLRPMRAEVLQTILSQRNASLDNFRVEEFLGNGSNGLVCKSHLVGFPPHTPPVSLKMAFNYGIQTKDIPKRCANEFNILSKLPTQHPNVIRMLHQFIDQPTEELISHIDRSSREFVFHPPPKGTVRSCQFFVLEFHRQTLPHRLESPMNEVQICKYACHLAEGVCFLKHHRIAHMDISLANLLISKNDDLVISDFGAAVRLNDDHHYASGAYDGNQYHRAPEILNGMQEAPRSSQGVLTLMDFTKQYSWEVGVLLFELCTQGRPPFEPYAMSFPVRVGRVDLRGIPVRFHTLLRGLLEEDPARRMEVEEAVAILRRMMREFCQNSQLDCCTRSP